MSRNPRELIRYGTTVVLGLAVDLAAAHAALGVGVPIALASVIGVVCGAAFNYVLLANWAFSGTHSSGAVPRPLRYLGALSATMAVRAGTVWGLSAVLPASTYPLVIFCIAMAVSFAVNFLLSKHWVFRRSDIAISSSGD